MLFTKKFKKKNDKLFRLKKTMGLGILLILLATLKINNITNEIKN
jgi:hypothetical protein